MNGETIAMIKALQNKSIENLKTSGGTADAGKVLAVGGDGKIAPIDLPVGEGQIALDGTLTIHGAAAGAKETGDAIRSLNGSLGTLKADLGDLAIDKVTSLNHFDNIFDKTGYYINSSTGEDVANQNFKCSSKFYPIGDYNEKYGKIAQYTVTSVMVALSLTVVYYDEQMSIVDYISLTNMSTNNKYVNINARYFRVSAFVGYDGQLLVANSAPTSPIDYTYEVQKEIYRSALPEVVQDMSDDYNNGLRLSKNNYTDADKAKVDSIDSSPNTYTGFVKSYFVGDGFTYAHPVDAWNQWVADGKPKAVFRIGKGTYNVMNNPASTSYTPFIFEDADVQIIGEDPTTTIIKSTTGKYIHSPIFIRSGNVTVKNITFIADHSDNLGFDYSQASTGLAGNGAYAMHIDGGSVGGAVVVDNCRAWSYQSCGLGLGTIKDSSITINNCDVRSFTDAEADYPDARVALSRGALVYHTYGADDTGEEVFSLNNTFIYSKNGTRAMLITKMTGNAPKDLVCKCNLIQGDAIADVSGFVVGINLLTLSPDSYGNNVPDMNYSN